MENTFITESLGSWFNTLPAEVWGVTAFGLVILVIFFTVWSIAWKGLALWKAVQLNQRTWFIILLVAKTGGILEIIYYFLIARPKEKLKE